MNSGKETLILVGGSVVILRCTLYKIALWYIGKCNKKWDKNNNLWKLKDLGRLTYKNKDKYYLFCGGEAEWSKFSNYDVLNNAIQKLAEYENRAGLTRRLDKS